MHTNTVQVTSLRQDGTAFKCTIPEEGEVWMSIPDNMQGHIEWKSTYQIGWTKNPRKTGGFFYNLKQLKPASTQNVVPISGPAAAGHNGSPPAIGSGSTKDEDIGALAIFKALLPLRAAHESHDNLDNGWCAAVLIDSADIWRRYKRASKVTSVPNIEDTW